jgi:CubicO group peptidase (beta-lactamase class C family)
MRMAGVRQAGRRAGNEHGEAHQCSKTPAPHQLGFAFPNAGHPEVGRVQRGKVSSSRSKPQESHHVARNPRAVWPGLEQGTSEAPAPTRVSPIVVIPLVHTGQSLADFGFQLLHYSSTGSFMIHSTNRFLMSVFLLFVGHAFCTAQDLTVYSFPTDSTVPETGIETPEFESFDSLMRDFVQTHKVTGTSLAVAKDGRLVYARGFGYGDLKNRSAVEPDSLFRIASISKPIAACAIMHLAERKQVALDASAFKQLGIDLSGTSHDPRLSTVTVRQLLQHTAGWDRNQSFDPMARNHREATMKKYGLSYPFDPQFVVRSMLDKPLDFDPGSRYAYSNFGYCILGRLIEKASGESYESYVQKHLLSPIGVRGMKIGRSNLFESEEVRYYLRDASDSEKFSQAQDVAVEIFESHGGWIGSAIDLVRFANENNESIASKRRGRRQILSPESFQTMFDRPTGNLWRDADGKPRPAFYGCGWEIRPRRDGRNIWHTGSLPGTSSLVVRRHDGLCWVVLFNVREASDGKGLAQIIDPLIHRAAAEVKASPDRLDLFRRY